VAGRFGEYAEWLGKKRLEPLYSRSARHGQNAGLPGKNIERAAFAQCREGVRLIGSRETARNDSSRVATSRLGQVDLLWTEFGAILIEIPSDDLSSECIAGRCSDYLQTPVAVDVAAGPCDDRIADVDLTRGNPLLPVASDV
jgi:hypothetical protein